MRKMAGSAVIPSVTLDMKMPSSSPLKGVEPIPPAIERPSPPVVLSILISYCSSRTSNDGSTSDVAPGGHKLKFVIFV